MVPPPREVFGSFAREYERYRPDYPATLWETLLSEARFQQVVDLGCGTGRAALELSRRGYDVVGIEPEFGMRQEARDAARREQLNLEVRPGRAEETGLDTASADLVVAAQAFHWFDPTAALAEAHRLLRPAGTLAIWWNDRRVQAPYMLAYESLIERYNPEYRQGYRLRDWEAVLAEGGLFTAVRRDDFEHTPATDTDGFIALALTSSYIRNALSPARLQEFQVELRQILVQHVGTGTFEIPYSTRLYRARAARG